MKKTVTVDTWRIIAVLALSILVVLAGIGISQSLTGVEAAKANLALEEAKERIVIFRVVEEEWRLKVSILKHQIEYARIQKALTPKVDPNALAIPPLADPNSMD